MTAIWNKISRNAFSNLTGTVVSLAVGFFLMPFVIHRIGATSFGIWILVTGLVGYMGLLDIGLAPTLVKKSAEYLVREDPEAKETLSRTVSTVFVLYLFIGAAVGLAIACTSLIPQGIFKVPPEETGTFKAVLWIVGLQTAASFPMSVWNGLLGGLQDFHVMNGLGIVNNLLRAFVTVVLLLSGFGLISLIWAGLGVAVFGWLVSWWWVQRRIPHLQVSLSLFDMSNARGLAHFSGAMFIWSIAGYAVHQADRVLIGLFLPVASITTYEVGARISNYSRNVLHSWLSIIMPAASALSAKNEKVMLQKLYLRGTKYLLVSYAGVVVALLGFGKEFMSLWMGKEFGESVWIMNLLLVGSLYQSQNVVAHVMLPGMGKLRVFTNVMIAYPVVVILLGMTFIFQWGLVGMAAAIALSMMLMETCFLFYITRIFEVTLADLLKTCHLPVALSAAPAIAWIFFALTAWPAQSWVALSGGVVSCLVVYALSFWILGVSRDEREALKRRALDMLGQAVRAGRPADVPAP